MRFKEMNYEDFLKQYDLNCLRPFPATLTPDDCAQKPGKRLYLRHDIDSNIDASVRMAEYEASIGIKSHYYALHFSDYWNPVGFRKLLKIQRLGHEVGFHNAVISEYLVKTGKNPSDMWSLNEFDHLTAKIEGILQVMRAIGLNVRGTCAHGHPTCITHDYGNIQVWEEANRPFLGQYSVSLSDFGLQYDCNIAFRNAYHSDSGNEWNGDPEGMAKLFRKAEQITLMINIHPQWWV